MRAHEPHVRGLRALHVPSTGITDYRAIAEKLGELVAKEGGEIHLGRSVRQRGAPPRRRRGAHATAATCSARQVVVCAGLRCDELARASGADPGVRIIPFRGEYYEFGERAAGLVKGLIYPVPDPAFPFLGVHATRGIDGSVHAGPNAVLALAREGYAWGVGEAQGAARVAGLPRDAAAGPAALALRARRGAPVAVPRGDGPPDPAAAARRPGRRPAPGRRRACGPRRCGRTAALVDDFLFVAQGSTSSGAAGAVLHVLNAPSPAATAALPIGREILTRLTGEKLGPL